MALPERKYTTMDIYSLPEGERAELIDGAMYMMAPPSRVHQRMVMELSALIHDHIQRHGGDCEVDVAPFAVFLDDDDRTYVEPDISVIFDKSKLDDAGCNGAPDWIIEIVSPSSRSMDYGIKLFKYRNAGVREYWIVDREKNRVMVYDFEHDTLIEYTFSDSIKVGIYDKLTIDLARLKL